MDAKTVLTINAIMAQAQVFASAWSLIGSRFDSGGELTNSETQRADLRLMLRDALEGQVKWRCFHCDEVLADQASARAHFGSSERSQPACQIDVVEYRAMEARMDRCNEEDSDMHRQIAKIQCEHQQALRREEEKGYARGLADAAALVQGTLGDFR